MIAVCFALPFATVSCDNASTTFTGIQLVTHTVPRGGVLDEAPDCSTDISACVERDASTTATIAFALALGGLVLGLLGFVRGPGWCAAGGAGALLVLPFEGPWLGPDVAMHYGWDLAVSLAVLAGCVHLRRAWRRRARRPRGALGVHVRALGIYVLFAVACTFVSDASDSPVQAVGAGAMADLLFFAAPSWLVVAVVLLRWKRQGRPELVQLTRRWDALLWLGPFLALALVSRRARGSLLPPLAPVQTHVSDPPPKELSCVPGSF